MITSKELAAFITMAKVKVISKEEKEKASASIIDLEASLSSKDQ